MPKIFVGSHIERKDEYEKENNRLPISKEMAQKMIEEECNCKYMECSALTQKGLKDVFDEAIRTAIKSKVKPVIKKKEESSCSLM